MRVSLAGLRFLREWVDSLRQEDWFDWFLGKIVKWMMPVKSNCWQFAVCSNYIIA